MEGTTEMTTGKKIVSKKSRKADGHKTVPSKGRSSDCSGQNPSLPDWLHDLEIERERAEMVHDLEEFWSLDP